MRRQHHRIVCESFKEIATSLNARIEWEVANNESSFR